jgi:hypothetical protein
MTSLAPGMKNPRTDPTTSLARERTIRENIAGQLAALDRKRPDLLMSDDPAIVTRHDAEVERLFRADRIHIERIAVLEQAQRDYGLQAAERRKAEALVAFEARLADRATAGARVEKAIAEFSASLEAYEAVCAAPFAEWPADLFPPLRQYWEYSRTNLIARIASDEVLAIKSAAPTRLWEIAQRIGPIAARDIAFAASLVESIRTAPLPKQGDLEIAA